MIDRTQWDPKYRIRVRVICARAYHALFMNNMLIRPTAEELLEFEPDFTIYVSLPLLLGFNSTSIDFLGNRTRVNSRLIGSRRE